MDRAIYNKNTQTLSEQQNSMNYEGMTPLHIASNQGDLEQVKALIERCDDLNPITNLWHTPLHFAVNRGGYEIVKLLLEKGAKVNALSNFDYTPLHYAANHGKLREAELLINKGAALNIQNTFGHTALHCTVNHPRVYISCEDCIEKGKYSFCFGVHGRIEIAKMLIRNHAKLHLEDGDGNTALDLAIKNGYPEVVEFINKEMQRINIASKVF